MNNKLFGVRSFMEDSTDIFGDEDTLVSSLWIEIYDKINKKVVCNISGYALYSDYCFLNATSVFDVLDCISEDCCAIGKSVCDLEEDEFKHDFMPYDEDLYKHMDMDTIFILDKLEVHPDFRGHGVGSFALSKVDSVLAKRKIFPSAIYGLVSPYEHIHKNDYQSQRKHLATFYKRNNYDVHVVGNRFILCRFPYC